MSSDNGRERVLNAVEALAVSTRPLQQRLEQAGLVLLPLMPRDFADSADGERLEEILRALSGVADPGEHGDLALSTFAMSDEEAVRVAQLIVDLQRRVIRW